VTSSVLKVTAYIRAVLFVFWLRDSDYRSHPFRSNWTRSTRRQLEMRLRPLVQRGLPEAVERPRTGSQYRSQRSQWRYRRIRCTLGRRRSRCESRPFVQEGNTRFACYASFSWRDHLKREVEKHPTVQRPSISVRTSGLCVDLCCFGRDTRRNNYRRQIVVEIVHF
jgi:hypothetical protein